MLFSNICTRTNPVQSTLISEGVKYRQNDESPTHKPFMHKAWVVFSFIANT